MTKFLSLSLSLWTRQTVEEKGTPRDRIGDDGLNTGSPRRIDTTSKYGPKVEVYSMMETRNT